MGAALLSEGDDSARVRKHAATIGNAAARMRHLIDQLLDVATLEHGKLELRRGRCEASDVFDTLLSLFQGRAIEARGELTAHTAPGLAVLADRERILDVLSNLVGNALEFTPHGGGITVTARRERSDVRFEVADTGPGIRADQVASVFERYWQGRSSPRGSLGLGLYICKQLVTAHDGQIGVETKVGAGSTFWFTLPGT